MVLRPALRRLLRFLPHFVALIACVSCQDFWLPTRPDQGALPPDVPGPATVRLATCWAGLPLTEDLRRALNDLYPDLSLQVIPASSAHARDLLLNGEVDLAIVARAPDEPADWGTQIQASHRLATDALAIIVHRDLELSQLSREELSALYQGYLQWDDLNAGQGWPLCISREPRSKLRTLFEEAILEEGEITTAALLLTDDRAIVDEVARNPQAIGYVPAALLDSRVKPVALDHVLPGDDQVRSGRYPLQYSLEIALGRRAVPQSARVLRYLLTQPGRALIARHYPLAR